MKKVENTSALEGFGCEFLEQVEVALIGGWSVNLGSMQITHDGNVVVYQNGYGQIISTDPLA